MSDLFLKVFDGFSLIEKLIDDPQEAELLQDRLVERALEIESGD